MLRTLLNQGLQCQNCSLSIGKAAVDPTVGMRNSRESQRPAWKLYIYHMSHDQNPSAIPLYIYIGRLLGDPYVMASYNPSTLPIKLGRVSPTKKNEKAQVGCSTITLRCKVFSTTSRILAGQPTPP